VLAEQLEDNPDGNLTDRQVEYASVIRSSGGDLLKLLNEILDLAKVESNTVNLEVSEIALTELRESLVQAFAPVAESQNLAFSVELDRRLPATIATDPHRLRQVLKNLVSNAFKFTATGAVEVRLDLSRGGWSPDSARLVGADTVIAISVRDTGIGIKKELQTTMFEAFAQADGTTARQYGGTGLGLSISRSLVGLLGGEIGLLSAPGQGSTFTVYLPLDLRDVPAAPMSDALAPPLIVEPASVTPPTLRVIVEPDAADPVPAAARNAGFYAGSAAGTKVLIVDDDFRNIFALTALLERGNLEVIPAESGPAALALLDERADIQIVLMDIMMPVMNGYETMAEIRSRPHYAELPIIAVTSKVMGKERERCIAAGASDYMPKPVDTAELLAVLDRFLEPHPEARTSAV